jgi:hypothetical protein
MRLGLSAAALGLSVVVMAGARADISVPPGTPVMLEFMQSVSSKTARKGDAVRLRVYTAVVHNGKTLIRQDAPAEGIVEEVHRRRSFGRKGELRIKLVNVRDVDGHRVPLEAYHSGNRFAAEGPGAAGGGLLVLGPVGAVAGVFVKGKEITIDKGTRIQAEVAGLKHGPGPPPVEPR